MIMYLLGIDDAGRGPIIGPMFLAGVLIKKEDEKILKELGARDSKLIRHVERIKLAGEIKEKIISFNIQESSPKEIDLAVETINLNTLEAKKAAEIINQLNDNKSQIKVIVDCPSVNLVTWKKTMISFIKNPKNLEIHCEHKADFNHPVVSAASILAKVEREKSVEILKQQYGNIGSGYPSDPYTKAFLEKHKEFLKTTEIVRKSWATWKNLIGEPIIKKKLNQKTLF
ncbi:ribonuclease HII [Candidatus Pacearchaeota archaeon]|nr:ribonuclease HII [Candidatus Pacearchaeota archaeon]